MWYVALFRNQKTSKTNFAVIESLCKNQDKDRKIFQSILLPLQFLPRCKQCRRGLAMAPVAEKSPIFNPNGAQKRKTADFRTNRTSLEESLLQSLYVWKLSAATL